MPPRGHKRQRDAQCSYPDRSGLYGYNQGCKCERCVTAMLTYFADYRERNPRGTCTWPECDRPAGPFKGQRCTGHRIMREIPGYRDVYCQLCGFGPRSTLEKHVNQFHEGTADYKRRFGQESLFSEDYLFNHRTVIHDFIEDGRWVVPPHKKVCDHGHSMRGRNVVRRMSKGRVRIECRQCILAAQARRRKPPIEKRTCESCGKRYSPTRRDQRFCSDACSRARRSRIKRRKCDWCGETFQPDRSTGRFCCSAHKIAWFNAARRLS